MTPDHSSRRLLANVLRFLGFVYRNFPLSRLTLFVTLCSLLVEYVTFSLMLPLSGQVSRDSIVYSFWVRAADVLGVSADSRSWLWIFLVLLAARTVLAYGLGWMNTLLSKQVHAYLSDRIFRRVVQEEPLAEIYRRSIGHYVSLAGDETSRAGHMAFNFGQMISAVFSAIAGLILLFLFSSYIFMATLAFIAFSNVIVFLLMNRAVAQSYRATVESRDLNTYFIDALNGIRSLRSMAVEPYVVETYRSKIAGYVMRLLKIDLINQAMKSGPALLLILVGIFWLWPGRSAASDPEAPMYFVAIATLLMRLFTSLGGVVTAGAKLFTDIRSTRDIEDLISERRVTDPAGPVASLRDPITSITFVDVACGYREGVDILKDVNAEFLAGHPVAIVGRSGAGKSTLADVVLGLLAVQRGELRFNGVLLSSASMGALRKRVVLVEQQTRIFTGSLRENILLGHSANDSEIGYAIRVAGLAEFVAENPDALDLMLEYQGANLSGGQRQRIGIARALVRKPEVLILDEATSALDATVRDSVFQEIRQMMRKGVLILITHDHAIAAMCGEQWRVDKGTLQKSSGRSTPQEGIDGVGALPS